MNEMSKETQLLRNLKDAGCDEATIKSFFGCKARADGGSSTDFSQCTARLCWIKSTSVKR